MEAIVCYLVLRFSAGIVFNGPLELLSWHITNENRESCRLAKSETVNGQHQANVCLRPNTKSSRFRRENSDSRILHSIDCMFVSTVSATFN